MMSSKLEIVNSTDYIITGKISYMFVLFSCHFFFVKPNKKWETAKRKGWPIIEVSAKVRTPRGSFPAKPYISLGTNQGNFEVVQIRENVFKVIRTSKDFQKVNPVTYIGNLILNYF